MAVYVKDFEKQVSAWPAPFKLTQQSGEVFLTMLLKPGYIEAKWNGHITAGDVVTASKAYLELIQEHPCPRLLNDKQNVTGDWTDANDWLEFEWMPQVVRAGMRCMAHVYSNNMFSRLSARDLYLRVTPRLQMSNFCDYDSAREWLLGCPSEDSSDLTKFAC